jgi:hypothetical protein
MDFEGTDDATKHHRSPQKTGFFEATEKWIEAIGGERVSIEINHTILSLHCLNLNESSISIHITSLSNFW